MIKANELRKNNLVLRDGKIVEVGPHALLFGDEVPDEPIPLTPEILEQCGFERSKVDGNKCLRYRYCNGIAEIYFTYFYESEFKSVSVFHKNDLIGRNCYSVHQLQNLFFALTGGELQINLNVATV